MTPSPLLPADWTPPAAMLRVHLHWTAGAHRASAEDRARYHVLVEGDGTLVRGDRSIAANAPGSGQAPASHTRGANTGAVGLALCGMRDARESPFDPGPSPLTALQWERAAAVAAELCRRYRIPVSRATLLSHAEVQGTLGIAQRGKWDVARLAFDPSLVGATAVGDRFRDLARAALGTGSDALRVTGTGGQGLSLRRWPMGARLAVLPEGARVERLARMGAWARVRAADGLTGWAAAAYLAAA